MSVFYRVFTEFLGGRDEVTRRVHRSTRAARVALERPLVRRPPRRPLIESTEAAARRSVFFFFFFFFLLFVILRSFLFPSFLFGRIRRRSSGSFPRHLRACCRLLWLLRAVSLFLFYSIIISINRKRRTRRNR